MAENKHATSRGRSLEVWMDFYKGSSKRGVGAFVVTPCYIWLADSKPTHICTDPVTYYSSRKHAARSYVGVGSASIQEALGFSYCIFSLCFLSGVKKHLSSLLGLTLYFLT